jgi:hypothetical protein
MSLDTIVSTAMLLGALFLMMRFGCGAHMRGAHIRKMSDPGRSGDADGPSANTEQQG